MSANVLMKNIYTFANILCQAGSEAVIKWDNKTLEKAFNWAKYCQQAYREIIGKPFEEEVNRHIKGMVIHLQPAACLHEFDLQTLQYSHLKLIQILIQNPYLTVNLLERLINLKLNGDDGDRDLIQVVRYTEHICQSPATHLAAVNMLKGLSDKCHIPNTSDVSDMQAQANVLLQYLINQSNTSSSTSRLETYINQLLQRVLNTSNGMEVILRLLMPDCNITYNKADLQNVQKVEQILVDFIQKNIHVDRLLIVDSDILCKVSLSHPKLFQMYTQSLLNTAEQMTPHYGSTDSGALYTWRVKDECRGRQSMSYKDLLQHFQQLSTLNKRSSQTVVQTLQSLSRNTYVNVYIDVLKHLEQNRNSKSLRQ